MHSVKLDLIGQAHAINGYYQFGCGILKMVGPKKQDFWSKINTLKGNQFYRQTFGHGKN